ncbi:cytochrome P450 [Daldinia bambusicola]|nr:cytochrome P450 [Daldinia bambusicola]
MVLFIILVLAIVLAIATGSGFISLPGLREGHLPPGPLALPFIGNVHSLPRLGMKFKLSQWAKEYGPIFSLKAFHGNIIVLNSAYLASELFIKRSAYYSNRPSLYVLDKLIFNGDHMMFMNADGRWKLRRKLYYQLMSPSRCDNDHSSMIEAEIVQTLKDLFVEPSALMNHPGRLSNSIIMSLVFGIRTPRHDTNHFDELRQIMTELASLGDIGATPPIDLLPFLKFLPERLWCNWKARAKRLREKMLGLYHPLVERVIERRKQHIASQTSFLDAVLNQQEKLNLTRNELDVMCGNLIEGGTDTISTFILTFFQAMANHPSLQKEAQEQIDLVIGDGLMPSWKDYNLLPRTVMIVKEVLRWRPPASNGFAHAASKDDTIDGMIIPKGSTIILNIWDIHHDPVRYQHPEEFTPSRFQWQTRLASSYANCRDHRDRDHFAYGAGRRLCPGIHLAERILFLFVVKVLWAYTIHMDSDTGGNPVPVNVDPRTGYHQGAINECLPFKVRFEFRSPGRQQIVFAEAEKVKPETFRM